MSFLFAFFAFGLFLEPGGLPLFLATTVKVGIIDELMPLLKVEPSSSIASIGKVLNEYKFYYDFNKQKFV